MLKGQRAMSFKPKFAKPKPKPKPKPKADRKPPLPGSSKPAPMGIHRTVLSGRGKKIVKTGVPLLTADKTAQQLSSVRKARIKELALSRGAAARQAFAELMTDYRVFVEGSETRTFLRSRPGLAALLRETVKHVLERFGPQPELGVGLCRDPEDGHTSIEVVVVGPPGDVTEIRHELQGWLAERIHAAPGAITLDVLSSVA